MRFNMMNTRMSVSMVLVLLLATRTFAAPTTAPSSPGDNINPLSTPFYSIIDSVPTYLSDTMAASAPVSPEKAADINALSNYLDARILARQGQTEQALAQLAEVQKSNPGSLLPQLAVIRTCLEANDLEGALKAAQALAESRPDAFEAQLALGRTYMAMMEKKPEDADLRKKAVLALEAARKIEPKALPALEPLGEMYWVNFRESKSRPDQISAATKVVDVYKIMLESARGRDRLLPLLYLAFTHQILGQMDESEEYFKKAIAIEPRNMAAYLQLTSVYETQGKKEKVLETLRQAVVIDPMAMNVQERLNSFLMREGAGKLLAFYKDFAEDFPASSEIQKLYAFQLVSQQKPLEAIPLFQKVADMDPGDWESRTMGAHLLIQNGRKDEAIDMIREVEKIGSADAEMLVKAATLYLEAAMSEDAERVYAQAVKVSPAEEKVKNLNYLIAFCLHRNEPEKALQVLDENLPQLTKEQQYEMKLERARILQAMARVKDAEKTLQELIAAIPENAPAYLQLGALYDQTGKDDKAEETYRELLKKMPKKPEAYLGLGVLYEQSEKNGLAEESYNKVLEIEPANVDAMIALGMLYDKTNRVEEAEKVYRRAIGIDSKNADAYNNLGYLFAARGMKLDEAKQLIDKALELNPEAPHIIDSLGWVLYQQGKYNDAVKHLETAAAQAGFEAGDAEVYLHLAQAYEKLNRKKEALAVYRKALRADPKRADVAELVVKLEKEVKE